MASSCALSARLAFNKLATVIPRGYFRSSSCSTSPEARAYLEAAATLSGDYERGRALKALITAQQLDGPGQVELIRQAARMGDYESSQVLTSLARRAKLSPEARKEYEKAAQRLGDYERQRALAALGR